ncbi:MAG: hypothetical protein ABI688_07375 [Bacteroidota bacterium]
MKKFLFTDGINGVIEVQSQEELETLISSTEEPGKIRIWLFSSNEWISYTAFRKQVPAASRKERPVVNGSLLPANLELKKPPVKRSHWLKRTFYFTGAATGIFLVFNFTKIKWEKAAPVNTTAARPANVPTMDIDSLIGEIESARPQPLDRSTRTNLRLRNTWPERILLQLTADRETNGAGSRFSNMNVAIDNTTGFNLDNAVVKLSVWKNNKISQTDTLRFGIIRYDKLSNRQSGGVFRGDSISVSFETIRAKAFNFCYSAVIKNNSGNYNDRWFCRE